MHQDAAIRGYRFEGSWKGIDFLQNDIEMENSDTLNTEIFVLMQQQQLYSIADIAEWNEEFRFVRCSNRREKKCYENWNIKKKIERDCIKFSIGMACTFDRYFNVYVCTLSAVHIIIDNTVSYTLNVFVCVTSFILRAHIHTHSVTNIHTMWLQLSCSWKQTAGEKKTIDFGVGQFKTIYIA